MLRRVALAYSGIYNQGRMDCDPRRDTALGAPVRAHVFQHTLRPLLASALSRSCLAVHATLVRLSLLVALATGCASAFYYPTHIQHHAPAELGLDPENIYFQSTNGMQVHGWYFHAAQPKGVIVFFHGNGQNLTSHFLHLGWVVQRGYDFLIFDYQGYGESAGEPTPENTVEDGKSAIAWTASHHPELPLFVFGQSLGGAVTLRSVGELHHDIEIRAIVVDSTFGSYQGMAAQVLSRHWLTWAFQWLGYVLLSDAKAPSGVLDRLPPTPLLVIHGDADETVDFALGQKLFEQAKGPKEFLRIPGGRHTDALSREGGRYREDFLRFLDRALRLRN